MFELLSLLLVQAQVVPSSAPPQSSQAQTTTDSSETSDDVIVTGARDLNDPRSAVTHRTLGSAATGEGGAVASRTTFELSERFVKCAFNISGTRLDTLREALDSTINSARQGSAQALFARSHAACAQSPSYASSFGVPTNSHFFDASYYDRGAMYIEALQRFVPNLKLTKQETHSPAVQARFNAREVEKARFRLPTDRAYFEAAVCLVREQPGYAVRLLKPRLSTNDINHIEAAMVNLSKECVGNARRVYFDATQFRFYIADAVYRWTVAARGVDTLIPRS